MQMSKSIESLGKSIRLGRIHAQTFEAHDKLEKEKIPNNNENSDDLTQ